MTNQIVQYVWAGLAAVFLLLGYLRRSDRGALWFAAILAAAAAFAARYDAFWAMTLLGLGCLWAAFAAVPVVDLGWRMRSALVFSTFVVGFLSLWPSLESMSGGRFPCPTYIEERIGFRLVAGLDLRGGLRLMYTVDVDEAIKDRRDRRYEDMLAELAQVFELHEGDDRPTEETLAKVRERVDLEAPRSPANAINLTLKDPADAEKIDQRFLDQFTGDLSYSQNADRTRLEFRMRETVESQIRESAVSQAREIILRRVDELGLREATVSTRDEDIIVEVPGEDEKSFKEIREIISQTARLEFKLLDDDTDFFEKFARNPPADLPEGVEFTQQGGISVGVDEEGNVRSRTLTHAFITKKPEETVKEALERFKTWTDTLELPPDRELGFEVLYDVDEDTQKEVETGWRTYLLKSRAELTGDLIRDAMAQPDQSPNSLGGWYVALTFTDQGGRIFETITGANVKRRFAIILDDRIESAPVIQTKIAGGHASITLGSNDPEKQLADARKLELVLRSGALPAPITPSNEQHIGPSLGRDAIRLGVRGALLGTMLTMVFMFLYYKRAGLIADVAVALNVFLQLAILASFGASMTLPGIAGLALTVGMSVDSNVLINERIRDELALGKSPRAAVEMGYSRAFSAIIDGHLTTLISAVVLAQFGTGPIKGFAVTLIVGVTTSIFTGIMVSRVMFDLWVRGMSRTAKLDVG